MVESLKIENGHLLNADLHSERMARSVFGVYNVLRDYDLKELIKVPTEAKNGVYKCRIVYDDKKYHIDFIPYKIRDIRSLKIVHDDEIDYSYKFLNRNGIDELFKLRGKCDDIIIIKNGFVTDTSFSNVILRKTDGNWVTPDTYLLEGTRRKGLLQKGVISETSVGFNDLKDYEEVRLINAMIDIDDYVAIQTKDIVS